MDTDERSTAHAPLHWSTLKEALGQKRRVIYMDDPAWEKLRLDAGHAMRSISAYLRDLVDGDTAIADHRLISSRQVELEDEIAAKDAEIAHLKRELAKRPAAVAEPSFTNAVAGPATVMPRGVHSPRQRVIDEALRKIGTKKP